MYLAHLIKPVISGNTNKTFKKEWLWETIAFLVVWHENNLRNLLKPCFILIGFWTHSFSDCAFIFFIYHCLCHFSLRISVIPKKGTGRELTCFWPYPFIHLEITVANYEKCASFEKWQSSQDLKGAYPLTGIYLFCYSWLLRLDSSKGDADSIFLYLFYPENYVLLLHWKGFIPTVLSHLYCK